LPDMRRSASLSQVTPAEGSNERRAFLQSEYSALRGEILQRTETQNQILSLSLIAVGTFITFGLEGSPTVLLAYPCLAFFLVLAWVQNDLRINQLGTYIRTQIEEVLLDSGFGWEHWHSSNPIGKRVGLLSLLGSWGILLGTQILAVLLALLRISFLTEDVVLLAVDGLVMLLTVSFFVRLSVRLGI